MNLLTITEQSSVLSLCTGFLVAGFLGSWHCALMCGPLACFLAEEKQLKYYHVGRLISYVIAGALAGEVSAFVFKSENWLPRAIILVLCLALIFSFLLKTKTMMVIHRKLSFVKKIKSGLFFGFSSVLLPCGWLYSFVAAAFTARSPATGALVMALFWISTLPSLSLAPMAVKKLIQHSSIKHQKVARAVLLVASLYSLSSFLFMH